MHLVNQYLQNAREAEAKASALPDLSQKAQWLEIANGYRNLAQARLGFTVDARTAATRHAAWQDQTNNESVS